MPRRGENIRKRADGRWEGRYIKYYDANGRAKYSSVYAKTYLEAKQKLKWTQEKNINQIQKEPCSAISFKDTVYRWLENNQIKIKSQTYAKYKRLIETHIVSMLGDISVDSVDAVLINRFLLSKSNNGRLDGNGGLSESYIRTLAFIIKSAIAFAAKSGYCSPMIGDILLPNRKKNKLEVLSSCEQLTLENHIRSEMTDKGIGVLLSLYMGLRIGEVCGIRWGDIDFDNKTIHVHNTVERIENVSDSQEKTTLLLGDVKTISSNRIIPIPTNLLFILKRFKRPPDKFILQGNSYDYVDPRSLQYYFKRTLAACNLRYINFHALRHTFATRCIESGMDIKALSEILGHSNVNITLNTYVHSSIEHKRRQIEIMSRIYGQTNGQDYAINAYL